ncbi:MAG: T9SS type A sorting domain-containing protein [Candidatus Kapaibacterium sp.]
MKKLKLFQFALVIIILLSANLYSQVLFKAYVKNQLVVLNDPAYAGANTIYFDMYLQQNGGPGPLYLADSDFKFTFNHAFFTMINGNADFKRVSGSTQLYNSLGVQISPSMGPTFQLSSNTLIINFQPPAIFDQEEFDNLIPKIDGILDKHKLGRFVVKTISNTSGTFGLTWLSGVGGTAVTSFDPLEPWNSNPATGTLEVNEDTPLPVQLASFIGNVENKRDVKLTWKTETEINNRGFELERKFSDGTWSKVGYIDGKGTTNTPVDYRFEDRKLNSGKYNYRLKQIDNNGNYDYYDLENVIEVGIPTKYDLSQNYPNPFNPTTKIDFAMPVDSRVSLIIYDMTGRELSKLINNEFKKASYYTVQFNGQGVSSGVYFYRIISDNFAQTKKMILVK